MLFDNEIDPEMLKPRTNLMQRLAEEGYTNINESVEQSLRSILNRRWGDGWTLDMVARRCNRILDPRSRVETVSVDGQAVMELHPIESELARHGDGSWSLIFSRNYRLL